jgi:hypothetical protein
VYLGVPIMNYTKKITLTTILAGGMLISSPLDARVYEFKGAISQRLSDNAIAEIGYGMKKRAGAETKAAQENYNSAKSDYQKDGSDRNKSRLAIAEARLKINERIQKTIDAESPQDKVVLKRMLSGIYNDPNNSVYLDDKTSRLYVERNGRTLSDVNLSSNGVSEVRKAMTSGVERVSTVPEGQNARLDDIVADAGAALSLSRQYQQSKTEDDKNLASGKVTTTLAAIKNYKNNNPNLSAEERETLERTENSLRNTNLETELASNDGKDNKIWMYAAGAGLAYWALSGDDKKSTPAFTGPVVPPTRIPVPKPNQAFRQRNGPGDNKSIFNNTAVNQHRKRNSLPR